MTQLPDQAGGLTRREFIAGLGVLAIGGALATSGCEGGSSGSFDDRLSATLNNLFSDRQSAGILGQQYLDLTPSEANRAQLLKALTTDKSAEEMLAFDSAQLHAWVQSAIHQDFVDDHFVELEHWLLSRTECRLCALTVIGET